MKLDGKTRVFFASLAAVVVGVVLGHGVWRTIEDQTGAREGKAHLTLLEKSWLPDEQMIWKAVEDFEDVNITRSELLAKLEEFVQTYPESERVDTAEEMIMVLRQIIAEDEAHETPDANEFGKLTKDEQIGELIFQLRDQNGRQYTQPGYCDIFADERGEKSPAHQLVMMGYDAVPQLIDALENRRLTRFVTCWRSFLFRHHVVRVGDCALVILERIAGREFFDRRYTGASMVRDNEATKTKRRAEEWWASVQTKNAK